MTRFLLAIQQPDGARPDDAALAEIGARLEVLNEDLQTSGSWVFTGGLQPAAAARVVDADGLVTDGPYVEAKEHLGGLWIIEAPGLDEAVEWGRRAVAAIGLPIEVRAFQDAPPA